MVGINIFEFKHINCLSRYEFKFGKVADYHLCVSEEMKKFLIEEIQVE
jgi:hypothetical protein